MNQHHSEDSGHMNLHHSEDSDLMNQHHSEDSDPIPKPLQRMLNIEMLLQLLLNYYLQIKNILHQNAWKEI